MESLSKDSHVESGLNKEVGSFGGLVRHWRGLRGLTQSALAFDCAVSARHLSFLENNRASPSRELVLRLAEHLRLSPGERNTLLLAAGYAPLLYERRANDHDFRAARKQLVDVLTAQEPNPSLAFDRRWNLVEANRMVSVLLRDVAAELLTPPVNLVRLVLHPCGLAPRIENLPRWRNLMLTRLRNRLAADNALSALYDEICSYSEPPAVRAVLEPEPLAFAAPFRLRSDMGTFSFLSTTMVFGTPLEVDLPELAVETFLPADEQTGAALRKLATMILPNR
jgi:transcriptional regulator with XRE-family HTH domain